MASNQAEIGVNTMKQTRRQRRNSSENRYSWGGSYNGTTSPTLRGSNGKRGKKKFPKRKNRRHAARGIQVHH